MIGIVDCVVNVLKRYDTVNPGKIFHKMATVFSDFIRKFT